MHFDDLIPRVIYEINSRMLRLMGRKQLQRLATAALRFANDVNEAAMPLPNWMPGGAAAGAGQGLPGCSGDWQKSLAIGELGAGWGLESPLKYALVAAAPRRVCRLGQDPGYRWTAQWS